MRDLLLPGPSACVFFQRSGTSCMFLLLLLLLLFQPGNFTVWGSEWVKVLPLVALKPEQKAPSFLRSQPAPHCGRTEQKKSERRKANQPKLHKADNNLNRGTREMWASHWRELTERANGKLFKRGGVNRTIDVSPSPTLSSPLLSDRSDYFLSHQFLMVEWWSRCWIDDATKEGLSDRHVLRRVYWPVYWSWVLIGGYWSACIASGVLTSVSIGGYW